MEGIYIFVCDRGFVVIGKAIGQGKLPFSIHLESSRTIRNWGTTKGLAELKDGPTKSTIVDDICERDLPHRTLVDIIYITDKGIKEWSKLL